MLVCHSENEESQVYYERFFIGLVYCRLIKDGIISSFCLSIFSKEKQIQESVKRRAKVR